MTLLTISQNIAKSTKAEIPNSIIGNTSEAARQIFEAVRIATEDLFRSYDWEILQKEESFNSVATQENYALPSDFDRIINDTFWQTTNNEKLIGPVTAAEWRYLKNSNQTPVVGNVDYFRIRQNEIYILPTPTDVIGYIYEYISDEIIRSSLSVAQKEWLADSDTSILDELLIELGGKWRYLKSIGKQYAEEQREYQSLLELRTGRDAGRRTIQSPTKRRRTGYIAFPQNVPTP